MTFCHLDINFLIDFFKDFYFVFINTSILFLTTSYLIYYLRLKSVEETEKEGNHMELNTINIKNTNLKFPIINFPTITFNFFYGF